MIWAGALTLCSTARPLTRSLCPRPSKRAPCTSELSSYLQASSSPAPRRTTTRKAPLTAITRPRRPRWRSCGSRTVATGFRGQQPAIFTLQVFLIVAVQAQDAPRRTRSVWPGPRARHGLGGAVRCSRRRLGRLADVGVWRWKARSPLRARKAGRSLATQAERDPT